MIPDDKIAEIKQTATVSEFISPYVELKRKGRSLMGLCPFHSEKTPSFSVSDENGFFHCFGCGAGGNVFKFLMLMENLSFPEAVRKVAARYGITVPEAEGSGGSERQTLYEVAASAARYFRACLLETPPGKQIQAYLGERGVNDESSAAFALGAAPVSGDGLVRWLRREGQDLSLASKLGLVSTRGGETRDRFIRRLMFPIRDSQGRTIGFGGRTINATDTPKYVNTLDSDIYHKGAVLYGLFEAREARRVARAGGRMETLLLVEGYLDVIALHQAGVYNVVATCGTALTVDQVRLMKRHAAEVVTLFDGDLAGRTAAARGFSIFLEAGLWPKGCFLPDGEDPDSLVKKGGREDIERLLGEAIPLAEAYVKQAAADAGGDGDRARLGADLAALLGKVSDPFEYDFLVKKAALWTGISDNVLRRQTRAPVSSGPPTPGRDRSAPRGAPGAEELLVTVMLADPEAIASVDESAIVEAMEEEPWCSAALAAVETFRRLGTLDPSEILEELPQEAGTRVAARLLDDDMLVDGAVRGRVLADCIKNLRRRAERRQSRDALDSLRRREERGEEIETGIAALKARRESSA